MQSKLSWKYVFFSTLLVLCSVSDSFKLKYKTEDRFNGKDINVIGDENNRSETTNEEGRGFGSIFTLGKVLNFFPVGGERECQPTTGYAVARSGICLNPYDCRQRDGKASGDCAHGLGVCCVFEVSCGGVVQNNLTWFMSPGFPEVWNEKRDCDIVIEKTHAGITQLRIDFVHFNIGQPNRQTGDCDEDIMTVGDEPNQFRLCGQNHGQHVYYTLSTSTVRSEDEDISVHRHTKLSIKVRGPTMPRLWLMRLAQMPLAYSAPHECLQHFTENSGLISTFNYASNGRYLANQEYKACIRRNKGFCSIRYTPCDDRSFRIGLTNPLLYSSDPVNEDGMMSADPTQAQEDMIEGSGSDPQIEAMQVATPTPTLASRIWRLLWPSWFWQRSWSYWSPYAQHYQRIDGDMLYQGYGQFGVNLNGFGRQGCEDRITIPCDNEYLISNSTYISGVCDPHHCGSSFCPGTSFDRCQVHSSVSPFAISVHFGKPGPRGSPEDNIGACLAYTQVPCGK